jgi:hypothetical protein
MGVKGQVGSMRVLVLRHNMCCHPNWVGMAAHALHARRLSAPALLAGHVAPGRFSWAHRRRRRGLAGGRTRRRERGRRARGEHRRRWAHRRRSGQWTGRGARRRSGRWAHRRRNGQWTGRGARRRGRQRAQWNDDLWCSRNHRDHQLLPHNDLDAGQFVGDDDGLHGRAKAPGNAGQRIAVLHHHDDRLAGHLRARIGRHDDLPLPRRAELVQVLGLVLLELQDSSKSGPELVEFVLRHKDKDKEQDQYGQHEAQCNTATGAAGSDRFTRHALPPGVTAGAGDMRPHTSACSWPRVAGRERWHSGLPRSHTSTPRTSAPAYEIAGPARLLLALHDRRGGPCPLPNQEQTPLAWCTSADLPVPGRRLATMKGAEWPAPQVAAGAGAAVCRRLHWAHDSAKRFCPGLGRRSRAELGDTAPLSHALCLSVPPLYPGLHECNPGRRVPARPQDALPRADRGHVPHELYRPPTPRAGEGTNRRAASLPMSG